MVWSSVASAEVLVFRIGAYASCHFVPARLPGRWTICASQTWERRSCALPTRGIRAPDGRQRPEPTAGWTTTERADGTHPRTTTAAGTAGPPGARRLPRRQRRRLHGRGLGDWNDTARLGR